jgi:ribosomal protein S18 acetylase RimI-like enzyme
MNSREIEILTYRELEQKDSLLPLLEQAFGWPFNPASFDKSIKTDPRLRDSSVGFCAIKGGKVVGYVGVMDFTLRTASGNEERVGGIYGVATHPEYTRQGISTTLLVRSHQYFMKKGYRFSFLTTSPTIVAHGLYVRLGYFDVGPYLSAYLGSGTKRQKALKRRSPAKPDHSRMLELFRQCFKGRTGFVIRDEEYLRMLLKRNEVSAKNCIVTEKGYVIFKKEKESVRIRELVAQSGKEMVRLIGLVEGMTRKSVVCRLGIHSSGDVINAYRSRGFTVLEEAHGVLMAKELVADASFKNWFGDRFYMSALDHF